MRKHLSTISIYCGLLLIASVYSFVGFAGYASAEEAAKGQELFVTYEGTAGPGKGKHIVLISGDEEYRSEEMLPQLGKILAEHHGFKCTVLFAIDPKTGAIDPTYTKNIPGLDALKSADLLILLARFRDLPPEQMKHIDDYVQSGKPIIGIRTSTHAFKIGDKKPYAEYSFASKSEKKWPGGFGKNILGETWISHHGKHKFESTRGVFDAKQKEHPILQGINDGEIWVPTDVYSVKFPMQETCTTLINGQVLDGMTPEAKPVEGKKNAPMHPVAWTNSPKLANGKSMRVFTTTMGCSQDLENKAYRRLLANASYWCLGIEDKISPTSKVDFVGEFKPTPFGFDGYIKGVKPIDHATKK